MSPAPPVECFVQGIATAVPEHTLEPRQSVELFQRACRDPRTGRLLSRIVKLTGVDRRHAAALDPRFAPDGAEALYADAHAQPNGPGMGARTALFERVAEPLVKQVLDGFNRDHLAHVDALVTVSCTHASSPGLERPVFRHSPVPHGVQRWNLGFMGCSAALAGLRLVHQSAQRRRSALVLACELSSLHFQYTDRLDQLTANLLFADGAAGMLVGPRPSRVRVVDCQCAAVPERAEQMVWFAGDHGLQLELSQDLPDTLAACVPGAVGRFLEQNGRSPASIRHWLVHPGGPQILDSVEAALHLPAGALELSRAVLRQYGNMSSPTILFILRELLRSEVSGPCVALAFGPGLTVELALLDIESSRA